ncbi:unnamed protein product, partial [Diamesa serratosioi]
CSVSSIKMNKNYILDQVLQTLHTLNPQNFDANLQKIKQQLAQLYVDEDLETKYKEVKKLYEEKKKSFDNASSHIDFIGMQNLTHLSLYGNKLTSVPIDVFSTLTKLKLIGLGGNQIEEIPNGVFSINLQLEQIHLYENKIKFLGSSVFDGLTELNYVSL